MLTDSGLQSSGLYKMRFTELFIVKDLLQVILKAMLQVKIRIKCKAKWLIKHKGSLLSGLLK